MNEQAWLTQSSFWILLSVEIPSWYIEFENRYDHHSFETFLSRNNMLLHKSNSKKRTPHVIEATNLTGQWTGQDVFITRLYIKIFLSVWNMCNYLYVQEMQWVSTKHIYLVMSHFEPRSIDASSCTGFAKAIFSDRWLYCGCSRVEIKDNLYNEVTNPRILCIQNFYKIQRNTKTFYINTGFHMYSLQRFLFQLVGMIQCRIHVT